LFVIINILVFSGFPQLETSRATVEFCYNRNIQNIHETNKMHCNVYDVFYLYIYIKVLCTVG